MPISTITRRAALTGTAAGAAAVVAGTAPALADDDHDRAEWLALWRDLIAKARRANDAFHVLDEAECEARQEHPVPPTIIQHRRNGELILGSDGRPLAITRGEMEWHHEAERRTWGDHPQVAQRQKARSAALKAHNAACRKVDRRFNVPAIRAAAKAAQRAEDEVERAIAERPAQTIVGIAVKLAYWVRRDGGSPMLGATLDDAPRESRAAIMAYRDAARLAGLPEDMYAEGRS